MYPHLPQGKLLYFPPISIALSVGKLKPGYACLPGIFLTCAPLIQSEKGGEIWYDDMDRKQKKEYRSKYKTESIGEKI
ncbi:hypothetical protein B5E62_14310 [Lachnoclostridium sp. An118]|nr:hypothetical protein B5E62_14310 [Lachnoclostridium sp. An118]